MAAGLAGNQANKQIYVVRSSASTGPRRIKDNLVAVAVCINGLHARSLLLFAHE